MIEDKREKPRKSYSEAVANATAEKQQTKDDHRSNGSRGSRSKYTKSNELSSFFSFNPSDKHI